MPAVSKLDSGRWRVQWRDAAGNWRSPVPAQSFATKTMARDFGLDREAEVRSGKVIDPNAGRELLKDWLEQWTSTRVAEPRTLTKIQSHLDCHVLAPVGGKASLGDLRLEQIDEMVLQSWVKRLQEGGMSPATIANVFTTLKSALRAAVRARRIPLDPTADVILPTIPPPSDFYWEREEIDAIRAKLDHVQDLALFELLLGTGVRWSEAAGLHLPRWQPLRRRLSVVEVLEEDKGAQRLKPYPKGKRRREIPAVGEQLLEAMARHLEANPPIDCGLDHGKGQTCGGLIFWKTIERRKRIGQQAPLSRHGWPNTFTAAVKAAGVRPGTVHDLRHTYASWLVLDGVPLRVVQALLGHSSIRTTERYSHLSPTTLDDPLLLASLKGEKAAEREEAREAQRG